MVLITGVGHPAMGHMSKLIDTVLLVPQHEEQAYNSCNDILHMCTDRPKLLAEEAKLCVESGACRYSYYKKALHKMTDGGTSAHSRQKLPEHENLRGAEIYQ